MKRLLLTVLSMVCFVLPGFAAEQTSQGQNLLEFTKLPPLPDGRGVAGCFAGVSGDNLLAAGGANFPDKMPWENGQKVWYDTIWKLKPGAKQWETAGKLPMPLGYGVSVSYKGQVICAGGSNSTGHTGEVFALEMVNGSVAVKRLPNLPRQLAMAGGALLGSRLYVVGGIEKSSATQALNTMYCMNLDEPAKGWAELEPLPGDGCLLPAVAAIQGKLYVFGGASLHADVDGKPARTYLKQTHIYSPGKGWSRGADMPRPAVAAPVIAPKEAGDATVVLLGGDDGSLVNFKPPQAHPGFAARVLTYNAVTNAWAERGVANITAPVTCPTVSWQGGTAIISGEVKPGVRSPACWLAKSLPVKASFGLANYTTLAVYLLGILLIGVLLSSGNETSDDYFRGGQKIPWWAAGLSIFATTLSSITFMSVPAKAFAEDWVFALANLPILLIAPFIVKVIMPVFRRMDATSAYEYLERRFSLPIRLFGSAAFILFQLGRMAIVMFLPALALSTVTSFDIVPCILLMGVLTIIYCVFGGISAVIWTDVVQSIVFLGGALLTIVLIVMRTDGGVQGFVSLAQENHKFRLANLTWDATVASLWVVVIGNIFANLISYASDQTTIQRYMTTADERKAARSIWMNALVAMPATALFFLVGTSLYVYYAQHPAQISPGVQNDGIFPLFIAKELPSGVGGLLVASIFAAAQSTISTSMNSVSTVLVTDWYERLTAGARSERARLALARWLTAIIGVLGTGGALWLSASDVRSVWDVFLSILGLTGGAMCGLFLLGIFSRRANAPGAIAGALASVIVLALVQRFTNLHFFLYGMTGILTCIAVGSLVSLVFPAPAAEGLAGLTYYDLKPHLGGEAATAAATKLSIQSQEPIQ